MKSTMQKISLALSVATIYLLSACSGDDGIGGSGETPKSRISGTAATGAPLVNKQVRIKAANGNIFTTTTNGIGNYSIEVGDQTGPYLIEVSNNSSGYLYSVAMSAGTANIHPLTDLVVRNWYSVKGHDIAYEFNRTESASPLPQANEISATESAFKGILETGLGEYGIVNSFDFFTTAFDANSLGFDRYLDQLKVSTKYSKINVKLKMDNFGSEANIIADVDLNTDFTSTDTQKPTDPNNVQILQGSLGLVVVWNESHDNRGVAGYKVFRNGTEIATTTFPLYSDANLPQPEPAGGYCYQVQAYDGAGLTSSLIPQVATCAGAPVAADNTAPAKPATPIIVSQASEAVGISWTPSVDDTGNGVLGYDVYRGSNISEGVLIATTVASAYVDLQANSNNGCYRIRAFDASRNTSVYSDPVCVSLVVADTTAPITSNSPAAATYNSSVTVRLSCYDGIGDSGCNATYYTFDSAANPNWLLYTQPLTISSSSTLRFYSIDNAGNEESPKSAQYVINSGGGNLSGFNFASATFNVIEDAGALQINVSRSGDLSASASVDFTVTSGGTATPGLDYESVSGTLTWAVNQGGVKSFTLPILADTDLDPNETIFLSLQNPSIGGTLGSVAEAVVTISDVTCANLYDYVGATTISQNTSLSGCWLVNNYFYINGGSGNPSALLTIQPGTTMIFGSSAGLNIQSNGAMSAIGTQQLPILFTAAVKAPNMWKGVQYTFSGDARNELAFVTIEYAGLPVNGSGNLMAIGLPTQLKVRDSVLRNGGNYGFDFDSSAVVTQFARNTMTGNLAGPGRLYSENVKNLDSASHYSGNGNGGDLDYVEVLASQYVTTNATWPTIDVPYYINGYLYIDTGNLNLSPGSVFLFDSNGGMNIKTQGSLNASGSAQQKILFTRRYPTINAWRGIQYTFSPSANNKLNHVIVEYGAGGSGTNGFGGVMAFGQNATLSIDNSTISDSINYGVTFEYDSVITSFTNNIITRNAQPVHLTSNIVDRLEDHASATGNDFTGNTSDIIEVSAYNITKATGTLWPNVGVPYRVSGRVYVYAPIVIEPGVTLYMSSGSSIWVGGGSATQTGRIVANANIDSPIIITSANIPNPLLGATAGDWQGIEFASSTNNSFDYVTVSYGGASGLNASANIVLMNTSSLSIHNSDISFSSGYGIWSNSTSTVTGVLASDGVTVNPDIQFSNNAMANFLQQ